MTQTDNFRTNFKREAPILQLQNIIFTTNKRSLFTWQWPKLTSIIIGSPDFYGCQVAQQTYKIHSINFWCPLIHGVLMDAEGIRL